MIIGEDRSLREPSVIADLAKRCGYLPLALRIAGERAGARPHLPLRHLVAELADEQRRLDILAIEEDQSMAVRTVFSWSYQLLQDDVALTFRRLGLHPGPDFDVHAAAALVGCTPEQVRVTLDVLASVHLIEEVGYDRFAFHDLLRIYAREMAEQHDSQEDITSSIDRMFAWYLHAAQAISMAISPHTAKWTIVEHPPVQDGWRFATVREALQWGDAESQNLMAALKFAADSQNHSVVSQLSIVTSGYLLVRSRWSDLADSLNIGVMSAQETKYAKAEAWNLILLDVVHLSLEHFDKALRTSIRALRIAQKLPDRWCEGAALHDLGMAFDGLGRLDEAVEHLERALDIYRAIEDRRGEGTVLSLLGDVLRRQQDFDSAEVHALQGLSIHRSAKNVLGEAYALRQVSRLYVDTGRVDKAVASLSAAAESFSQVQYRYERARALQELGSVEADIGRRAEARAHWREALVILQELKHSQAGILQSRLESLGDT